MHFLDKKICKFAKIVLPLQRFVDKVVCYHIW